MHAHIASLIDYSKVAKITARRHNIVFVSAEGYVCFIVVFNSRNYKSRRKHFFPMSGNTVVVSLLGCEVAGSTILYVQFLCFTTNFVLVLAFLPLSLCEGSVHVRAKYSNGGTAIGAFSNFNILLGRCSLLHFPSLTSLCAPGITRHCLSTVSDAIYGYNLDLES